jgi:hypothetical protein
VDLQVSALVGYTLLRPVDLQVSALVGYTLLAPRQGPPIERKDPPGQEKKHRGYASAIQSQSAMSPPRLQTLTDTMSPGVMAQSVSEMQLRYAPSSFNRHLGIQAEQPGFFDTPSTVTLFSDMVVSVETGLRHFLISDADPETLLSQRDGSLETVDWLTKLSTGLLDITDWLVAERLQTQIFTESVNSGRLVVLTNTEWSLREIIVQAVSLEWSGTSRLAQVAALQMDWTVGTLLTHPPSSDWLVGSRDSALIVSERLITERDLLSVSADWLVSLRDDVPLGLEMSLRETLTHVSPAEWSGTTRQTLLQTSTVEWSAGLRSTVLSPEELSLRSLFSSGAPEDWTALSRAVQTVEGEWLVGEQSRLVGVTERLVSDVALITSDVAWSLSITAVALVQTDWLGISRLLSIVTSPTEWTARPDNTLPMGTDWQTTEQLVSVVSVETLSRSLVVSLDQTEWSAAQQQISALSTEWTGAARLLAVQTVSLDWIIRSIQSTVSTTESLVQVVGLWQWSAEYQARLASGHAVVLELLLSSVLDDLSPLEWTGIAQSLLFQTVPAEWVTGSLSATVIRQETVSSLQQKAAASVSWETICQSLVSMVSDWSSISASRQTLQTEWSGAVRLLADQISALEWSAVSQTDVALLSDTLTRELTDLSSAAQYIGRLVTETEILSEWTGVFTATHTQSADVEWTAQQRVTSLTHLDWSELRRALVDAVRVLFSGRTARVSAADRVTVSLSTTRTVRISQMTSGPVRLPEVMRVGTTDTRGLDLTAALRTEQDTVTSVTLVTPEEFTISPVGHTAPWVSANTAGSLVVVNWWQSAGSDVARNGNVEYQITVAVVTAAGRVLEYDALQQVTATAG